MIQKKVAYHSSFFKSAKMLHLEESMQAKQGPFTQKKTMFWGLLLTMTNTGKLCLSQTSPLFTTLPERGMITETVFKLKLEASFELACPRCTRPNRI